MRILRMTLKKQWFDMIASGEKKEEYREIKPYWVSRLVESFDPPRMNDEYNFLWKGMEWTMGEPEAYDAVEFKNGYSKTSPTILIECKGIDTGYPNMKWCDEYKPVFVIKLGNIISINN